MLFNSENKMELLVSCVFVALTCTSLSHPTPTPTPTPAVKMWIPFVEEEEAGQREREFPLCHSVGQCLCKPQMQLESPAHPQC